MKQVFYNKEKAEAEEEEKERAREKKDIKQAYFDGLKRDRNFKKYIIEGILNKEIEMNRNISNNVEAMVKASPDEAKSMLLAKVGALKTAENIKNKITANF